MKLLSRNVTTGKNLCLNQVLPSILSSFCTHTTTHLINQTPITLSLHLSSAPNSDCGALETRLRTPSLPSPHHRARWPLPWVTAAQAGLLWCSARGRWPPGETRPDTTITPLHGRTGAASTWESGAVSSKLQSYCFVIISHWVIVFFILFVSVPL